MNTTGLIFAAGLGTRLRPITLTTPKPLVQINRKPIIEYQIDWFISLGITEIFINTHYLSEQFYYLVDKYVGKCKIELLNEPVILGHGGTLMRVKELATNEKILTCNGDTIISLSEEDMRNFLKLENAICLYEIGKDVLGFDEDKNLIRIREKRFSDNIEALTADFSGVAVFTKEYLGKYEYPEGYLGLFGNEDILEVSALNGAYVKGFIPSQMERYEITEPKDIGLVSKQLLNTNV